MMSDQSRIDLSRSFVILLAGGQGTRLHELTTRECKPAVPFAGNRRIVDFTMGNIVRSGLKRVLVATQYNPATLHDHLPEQWGSAFPSGALTLRDGSVVARRQVGEREATGYRGTADAVRCNWAEIDAANPREVLVLAGDHIYDMDYAAMIAVHRDSGAEATVAVDTVARADASAFGVLETRDDGLIRDFLEKPDTPPAMPGDAGRALVSMGIYVFNWPWLRDALSRNATAHDFGHDIIPAAVEARIARAYRLPPGRDGAAAYWRDVGTLDAYRLAQLDFAGGLAPCPLPLAFQTDVLRASGGSASLGQTLMAGGLQLHVPRLRANVADRWAMLDASVLMPGARLSPGVRLTNTIVAPRTVLPTGLVVGEDLDEDARWFRVTAGGTVLVTTAMLARRSIERPKRPVASPRKHGFGFNLSRLVQ